MDLSKLTGQQRDIRSMIRGFLLTATIEEMEREKAISLERGDTFRAAVICELIAESTETHSDRSDYC
jgi:hypothetical protein